MALTAKGVVAYGLNQVSLSLSRLMYSPTSKATHSWLPKARNSSLVALNTYVTKVPSGQTGLDGVYLFGIDKVMRAAALKAGCSMECLA